MYLLLYELFVYPRLGPDLVEERPLASLLARSHPPNLALVNRGGWKSILHKIHDNGWFKFRNSKFDVWQHLVFFQIIYIVCISLLLWKDKINTEINDSADLLALLF